MSLKSKWVAERVTELLEQGTVYLVNCAGDAGVQIDDLTTRKALARAVAEAEWEGDKEKRGPKTIKESLAEAGCYLHDPPAREQDAVALAFKGEEFEDMESGAWESQGEAPDPVVSLQRDIMQRWIGAIGGMDWYNGPTPNAQVAQQHGKALAAALDGVFQDRRMEALRVGPQPQTSSGYFIYEVLLPEFLERFLAKNADYGDQHRTGLGVRAEYVGIHRKIEKLKSALWDGRKMNGEDAREMLMDLIGQCFIVLDLMAQEEARKGN